MLALASHGPCFICGPDNPEGLGLTYYQDEGANRVVADLAIPLKCQGPPGFAHGGLLASVIDEAMGKAAWLAGHRAYAARLEIDYRKPVPIGTSARFEAWVERSEGRKCFTLCVVKIDGVVAVEGKGLFVTVRG